MNALKYLPFSLIAYAQCALSAQANPWIGTYSDHSGKEALSAVIRKLSINERKDHSLSVRIVIYRNLSDNPIRPITLEAAARGYSDMNNKGLRDTLIASFPNAKYKPLVIIRRDSPFEPVLNEHSAFKHLSYTFYENSALPVFVSGDVYRDDSPAK
jgi:hypothetical protein